MTTLRVGDNFDSIDSIELRILHLLQQTGSLTQVASQLGMSQPAVSQRIKRVETRLAVPLIERHGRGVRLTQAGNILAEHGAVVVQEIDAALAAIEDLRGDRGGLLRVVGFPSASATIIPQLMRKLAEHAPAVTFQYREQEPPEAIELLKAGEVDCALIFQYDEGEALMGSHEFIPLWQEELCLVAPTERVAGLKTATLESFSTDPWIAGCTKCRGHLLEVTRSKGFEPDIIQETDNMPATIAMVAAGESVAMVPGLAIASQGSMPKGAKAINFTQPQYRTIGIVCPETVHESPAVRLVKRLLKGIDGRQWGLTKKERNI
ncbi:MAG TPA: LysR family transcriptional regulator [Microbacteriaceae bacterium]|nr:LysR family transcriptional regulator [Microbacteriaceae bacterium]